MCLAQVPLDSTARGLTASNLATGAGEAEVDFAAKRGKPMQHAGAGCLLRGYSIGSARF